MGDASQRSAASAASGRRQHRPARLQDDPPAVGSDAGPPPHPAAAPPAEAERERWSSPFVFVLASIGSAIGFGNIWRFPLLAFEYGGGAFLVPYVLALFFTAIPIVVLEFGLGQTLQLGHVKMCKRIMPQAVGFGWAAVIGTFLVSQMYNALLAYCVVYLLASFRTPQPWSDGRAAEYFRLVLESSGSVERPDGVVGRLALAYAFVWALVYAGVQGGARSLGWLVQLLMPAPFLVLLALLVRGLTLDGALDGVRALLTPDWAVLGARPEIWMMAVSQIFFGVSAGLGTLTTYASYTPRGTRTLSSAAAVCLGNSAFSLLAALVVFAFLGHMARVDGVRVGEVAEGGSSLAFEVFPTAVSLMPAPRFWAAAFFVMLLNLGVSSAASMTSPLTVALVEEARRSRLPWLASERARAVLPAALHAAGFLTGLPYVSHAGEYWIDLANHFLPMFLTVVTALGECLLVSRVYGARRLLDELGAANGELPGARWLELTWCWFLPALLTVLFALQCYSEIARPYGGFPGWFLGFGWLLSVGPMACVPMALCWQHARRRARARAGAKARDAPYAVTELERVSEQAGGAPRGSAPARAGGAEDARDGEPRAGGALTADGAPGPAHVAIACGGGAIRSPRHAATPAATTLTQRRASDDKCAPAPPPLNALPDSPTQTLPPGPSAAAPPADVPAEAAVADSRHSSETA